MPNSATPELTKGPPIADGLDLFRDVLYDGKDPRLASIDALIHQLDENTLRSHARLLLGTLARILPETASALQKDLEKLRSSISNKHVLDRIKPIIKAALADKPNDTLIWNLVSRAAVDFTTPPRPNPIPSRVVLDDTPITHSSASQQGSEQTKKLLEARIFEEIGGCTYRNVQGFFEKYFEGRPWIDDAVYESIRGEYTNGEWGGLGESPSQDQVLNWLFKCQKILLSEATRRHYTINRRYYTVNRTSELAGGEAKRQIDLLVERESRNPLDTNQHEWKDIAVIGELKTSSSEGVKGPLIQLARYARDVFSSQPTRRFLHAFTICGRKMETWVFDRSGVYSGGPFDIHNEPERFMRIFAGYLMMNEDELGLDTFIQRDGDSCFIDIDWEGEGDIKKRLQLQVAKPLAHSRSIVSRATSCYSARVSGENDDKYVVKFSWPPAERTSEVDFLRLASQRGVKGIAGLAGHCHITNIDALRHGMAFPKLYSFRGTADALIKKSRKRPSVGADPQSKRRRPSYQRSGLWNETIYSEVEPEELSSTPLPSSASSDEYDNRIFRCLVTSPVGRPIYAYKSPLELLEALRDAIRAHQSLYIDGNILHRDISENNIIITPRTAEPRTAESDFAGILIDLDLATEIGSQPSGARCRTGTMEFMAIDVLFGENHTYRHDLESFFYVLLWQIIRPRESEYRSRLTDWYLGTYDTYDQIANVKRGRMLPWAFKKEILVEFPVEFERAKPLCEELRSILFGDGVFTGTPEERPEILYGQIIDAFDKGIHDIREARLVDISGSASSSPKELASSPTRMPRPISTAGSRKRNASAFTRSAIVRPSPRPSKSALSKSNR